LIHLFPSADPLQSHIRRLQVLDGWRLSQTTSPYTEWQHFVVLYGTMRLLLNFSLRVETTGTTYRLLALIGNQEGWSGDVIEVPAIIRRGAVDSLFGDSSVRLVGEVSRTGTPDHLKCSQSDHPQTVGAPSHAQYPYPTTHRSHLHDTRGGQSDHFIKY